MTIARNKGKFLLSGDRCELMTRLHTIFGNPDWAEGDFGGDGEFDTDDLVLALQTGAYERGPRAFAVGG